MGTVLNSIDRLLYQADAQGMWRRAIAGLWTTSTAALTTCGYTTTTRYPVSLTIPTLGGSVTAAYVTYCRMSGYIQCPIMCAYEVDMGTLTVSGNVFADGSAMPTRTVAGSSIQLASMIPIVVATAALTSTTPVLTITYTDQGGNTAQTCTMTLPTSPVINTGFIMTPHLANGDTGVQDITNISISTGSAGTLKVYGIMPIAIGASGNPMSADTPDPLISPFPMIPLLAGDVLSFYRFGQTAATDFIACVAAVGDD